MMSCSRFDFMAVLEMLKLRNSPVERMKSDWCDWLEEEEKQVMNIKFIDAFILCPLFCAVLLRKISLESIMRCTDAQLHKQA